MKKPFCLRGTVLLPVFVYSSFVFALLFAGGCKKADDVMPVSPPLHVNAAFPRGDKAGSLFDDDITATLNAYVDTTRYQTSIVLTQSEHTITGITASNKNTVSFTPEPELLPLTSYTATLRITSKSNGSVVYYYQWDFTTKGPDEYSMTQRSTHVTNFERDGTRCMQIGDYLYSFGGWTDNGGVAAVYSDVYRSRKNLSTWERRKDAPWHGRHVYGLVKLNGFTYVVGGDPWQPAFDVWRTADGEKWTLVSQNQLGNRVLYGCAAHNGYIYVAGGEGHNDVWRSRNGIEWEQVAENPGFLKGENFAGSLVSFNGRLWMVCGGGNGWGGGMPRNEVWSSANGKTWRREPDFPGTARYYTDVCVWDNKLWVIGGYNYTEGNTRSIWFMRPNGRWEEYSVPQEYIGRHATGLAVYNNSLTITCGNYHNDCWVIEKVK